MSPLAFQLHALATLTLVGLIWTVQLVHYPLMAEVRGGFERYHELHKRRITWLVGPLMLVEALTAALLVYDRPVGIAAGWAWLGLALVAVNWLATARLSMPQHARLARGRDERALALLVTTNWIRTAAWTARGLLVLGMAPRALAVAS